MKVGDYVRTEKGKIDKYSPMWVEHNKFEDSYYYVYPDKEEYYDHRELIIKSSPNIIDLIEVGDYVNGFYVINKPFNQRVHTEFDDFMEEDIKSIVTKEQFESMQYNLESKGDDKD